MKKKYPIQMELSEHVLCCGSHNKESKVKFVLMLSRSVTSDIYMRYSKEKKISCLYIQKNHMKISYTRRSKRE